MRLCASECVTLPWACCACERQAERQHAAVMPAVGLGCWAVVHADVQTQCDLLPVGGFTNWFHPKGAATAVAAQAIQEARLYCRYGLPPCSLGRATRGICGCGSPSATSCVWRVMPLACLISGNALLPHMVALYVACGVLAAAYTAHACNYWLPDGVLVLG